MQLVDRSSACIPLLDRSSWEREGRRGGPGSAGSATARPLVLSAAQISPRVVDEPPSLTIAGGGRSVVLRIPAGPSGRVGGGARGAISRFTWRSWQALAHFIESIDGRVVAAGDLRFVTLTYPGAFPSPRVAKRQFDAIWKRFEREWGARACVWKLEPQARGAPHLHLLLLMGSQHTLPHEIAWWSRVWFELAGGGDVDHLRFHRGELGNRPCVEVVRDRAGVGRYVGKYMGKLVPATFDFPGRFWGVRRRELFKRSLRREDVPRARALQLRRVLRRYLEHQLSGRWRWEFPGGRVSRGWLSPEAAAGLVAQFPSLRLRAYHRRIRLRRGGLRVFMSDSSAERLLAWVATEVRCDRSSDLVARPGVHRRSAAAWLASGAS